MFLTKKIYRLCLSNLLGLLVLSSCQVSQNWEPGKLSYRFPMNHAPSRPTSYRPVAYPVPAPSRASVATGERRSVLGIPVPTFRTARQATAIRESRPSWPQPVASYTSAQPVSPPPVIPPTYSAPGARGKVRLVNGLAVAPPDAPAVVHRAVAAGNRLQKMPYKWGGGHAKLNDNGYDCSGTVSYVLREAGLMQGQMPSRGFFNYGESGEGDWITVWVRDGHVFMIVGGLRLDTGGSTRRTGPRWKTKSRSYKGLQSRHLRGL